MPSTLQQVTEEIRELSPQEREQLISALIRDFEPADVLSQDEIDRAWNEEIERRLEEIDSGKVKTVPAEKVFARIQSRLDEIH